MCRSFLSLLSLTSPICTRARSFLYISHYVSSHDMTEGLRRATAIFEALMIGAFDSCRQLHVIMLAVTLALFVGYALFLVR